MTVPTPPYTPRLGYRIYGYERTTDGLSVLFPRSEAGADESQGEEPELVQVPGVGEIAVDSSQLPPPQPKRVAVSGSLYSGCGIDLDELLEVTAGPGKLWRVNDRGQKQWSPVVRTMAVRSSRSKEQIRAGIVPVSMEFELPTGLWYSQYLCSGGLYGYARFGISVFSRTAGGAFRYPLKASPMSFVVPNIGSAWARALIIRVAADAAGGVTGPVVITNSTANYSVTMTGDLAAGSSWVLDTTVPSFKKDGVDDWANLTMGTGQRSIMVLHTRRNSFTLTHGGVVGADNYVEFEFYEPYY